ncbi:MAG: Fe-S cluster assembly protein SufD [Clostridium sp.]|nr:Fe-S cluster assembly protein SufD [Clostridium sp.]
MTTTPKTNSLTQYLDLYRDNRALIDSASAPLLNQMRPAAYESLAGARLPERGDESYEKTSVNDLFAPDYGVNLAGIDLPVNPADSFRCGVPNLSTRLAIVANDRFHATSGLESRLPEGVRFMSLRRAAETCPDLVSRWLGKIAPADDPCVALNTLLLQDGVFIHIPRGVRLEKPLQLVNIFDAPADLLAFRRVLVVAEENAEGRLLVCDHTASTDPDRRFLSSLVVEVAVGEGASFDYYDIEESSPATSRVARFYARQEKNSRLTADTMTLQCGQTRNDWNIDICGEHCETLLAGMAIATDRQHIDNFSAVRHLAPRCSSNQLFKYVLDDRATGAFEGGILVTPAAPFTEAYQSNRNILASPSARMHTKPQLEIYNDEVRCSHGATTGQLDREALFYMQTRGIPEKEARMMLMQAFTADVIDMVRMEGLRERLTQLVDRRFHRCEAHCADCGAQPLTPPQE